MAPGYFLYESDFVSWTANGGCRPPAAGNGSGGYRSEKHEGLMGRIRVVSGECQCGIGRINLGVQDALCMLQKTKKPDQA